MFVREDTGNAGSGSGARGNGPPRKRGTQPGDTEAAHVPRLASADEVTDGLREGSGSYEPGRSPDAAPHVRGSLEEHAPSIPREERAANDASGIRLRSNRNSNPPDAPLPFKIHKNLQPSPRTALVHAGLSGTDSSGRAAAGQALRAEPPHGEVSLAGPCYSMTRTWHILERESWAGCEQTAKKVAWSRGDPMRAGLVARCCQ